jgi:hypothetical protein
MKIIRNLKSTPVCAVIPVAKLCGVAADNSICNFESEKSVFYVRVHVICLNDFVCVEKLEGQMMNSDLILQTLYLGLDNTIY